MSKPIVISMDSQRLSRTAQELRKIGITDFMHFEGVDGKVSRETAPELTSLCRRVCTDKIVGVGLAHIRLAKKLLETGKQGEVYLVLEDDIKVKYDEAETQRLLETTIKNAPQNWDIITVFCQGNCSSNKHVELDRILHGSTAAYLLSWSGVQKMANEKLVYHIDHQRNSLRFNTQKGPQVFDTYDPTGRVRIGNQSIGFWAKQDLLRFGSFDINVLQWLCFVLLITIIISTLILPVSSDVGLKLLLFIVAWHFTIPIFTSLEYLHYKCSLLTHVFGIAFPLLLLITVKISWRTFLVVLMALMMLIFHGLTYSVHNEDPLYDGTAHFPSLHREPNLLKNLIMPAT